MNFIAQLTYDLANILYAGKNIRAKTSGVLICIILFLDLHRFGAWYTGNQAHIKWYWYWILLIVSMPFNLYCLKLMLHWYVKQRKDLSNIRGLIAGVIAFIIFFLLMYLTQDFSKWNWLEKETSLLYWSKTTVFYLLSSTLIGWAFWYIYTGKADR